MKIGQYTKDEPTPNPSKYVAAAPDEGVQAYLDDVKRSFRKQEVGLVDVRSVKEFNGEITCTSGISNGACSERWTYSRC